MSALYNKFKPVNQNGHVVCITGESWPSTCRSASSSPSALSSVSISSSSSSSSSSSYSYSSSPSCGELCCCEYLQHRQKHTCSLPAASIPQIWNRIFEHTFLPISELKTPLSSSFPLLSPPLSAPLLFPFSLPPSLCFSPVSSECRLSGKNGG